MKILKRSDCSIYCNVELMSKTELRLFPQILNRAEMENMQNDGKITFIIVKKLQILNQKKTFEKYLFLSNLFIFLTFNANFLDQYFCNQKAMQVTFLKKIELTRVSSDSWI